MRLHENTNIFIHGPSMFFAAPHMVLMKISGAGRYETECRQPKRAEEMSTVGGSARSGRAPVRTSLRGVLPFRKNGGVRHAVSEAEKGVFASAFLPLEREMSNAD